MATKSNGRGYYRQFYYRIKLLNLFLKATFCYFFINYSDGVDFINGVLVIEYKFNKHYIRENKFRESLARWS